MQIHITRACDQSCFGCTQGSNLGGKPVMMSVEQFERACQSLEGYFGVVGVFGGNPAMHPDFDEICEVMRSYFPFEQRGLWCNNPRGKGKKMRDTFNPAASNLNVHLSQPAFDEFKRDWPESMPFGLERDSRHSPPYVAMLDVLPDEAARLELIGKCDINRYWSAMIAAIPGKGLRGFFCELAGAQAILHANDPQWPDTGVPVDPDKDDPQWWQLPMASFGEQVKWNCHRCGVPLKRYGHLAVEDNKEEVGAEEDSEVVTTEIFQRCERDHDNGHPRNETSKVLVIVEQQVRARVGLADIISPVVCHQSNRVKTLWN